MWSRNNFLDLYARFIVNIEELVSGVVWHGWSTSTVWKIRLKAIAKGCLSRDLVVISVVVRISLPFFELSASLQAGAMCHLSPHSATSSSVNLRSCHVTTTDDRHWYIACACARLTTSIDVISTSYNYAFSDCTKVRLHVMPLLNHSWQVDHENCLLEVGAILSNASCV